MSPYFVIASYPDVSFLLVNLPEKDSCLLAHTHKAIRILEVLHMLHGFSVHGESAVHLVQAPSVQKEDSTLAEPQGKELLYLISVVVNTGDCVEMLFFIQNFPVESWD